jgi:release factor glutamine methyltransferase
MTVNDALQFGRTLSLDRLDVQLLLLHACNKSPAERSWLLAHGDAVLPPLAQQQFQGWALRRASGEPLGYLTGHKEFYGLDLAIDARVLDPRADTETLVDWALELPLEGAVHIMDLGTGSGAIALALQQQRAHWQVHAVDFSVDALAVAQGNAQRLHLPVHFAQGDWLAGTRGKFHAIVSNPPYIAAQDDHLAALAHEPLQALTSGVDGLDAIRTIITQAPAHLHGQGWLLLEHGYDQANKVRELLQTAGFSAVQSRRDLAGIARCSGGRWDGV